MDKFIISIVGPTGIGKTNLSLKLASHFQTEIISADSRQFYKEIPIGTAAPSAEELQSIPHHFIHHKSITESYNVGQYEKEALERIKMLHETHRIVILVGGSGLYINSILKGLDTFPKVAANIREELNLELKIHGIEILQKELKIADPETYAQIDLNNSQRIIRALEICRGSRQPFSQYINKEKKSRVFNVISIGLEAERSVIYQRIHQRVDKMIERGLIEEAISLYNYRDLNALNTVGYKELFNSVEGTWSVDNAIEEIKKNSRRYAKRQLTWFKKDSNTKWYDYKTPLKTVLKYIESELASFSNKD